jgi:hypothetical protein
MRKILLFFAATFALFTAAVAQDVLTNESIVKLVKSGLGSNLIVSMVENQPGQYTLTPDEVVKLKDQGVPEIVLAAMVTRGSARGNKASGATPTEGAVTGDPNDPMVPHDSGIWLYTKDREGKPQMVVMERASYQGSKTGGVFAAAMTYGIKKAKTKAILPGRHASLQTADANPMFYFYFEDKATGLGKTYFGQNSVSNPNQFALIKLEMSKTNRETVIGQFGLFSMSTGTSEKAMVGFKSERIRTGLYKVTPSQPLAEGEYCFLASGGTVAPTYRMGAGGGGAATAADIFDFGIHVQ